MTIIIMSIMSEALSNHNTFYELRQMFSALDLDGDSKITQSEVKNAIKLLEGYNHLSDEVILQIFHDIDRDGNGIVDFDEVMAINDIKKKERGEL